MRKYIKYNHLVANCVIFHNVVELTCMLNQLHAEEHHVAPETISALSPYLTWHIHRFSWYHPDLKRQPFPIDYELAFGMPVNI